MRASLSTFRSVPGLALVLAALVLGRGDLSGQAVTDSVRPLRPIHDLGGAFVDFASDGWAVLSTPSRLDASGWGKVGGTLAVGGLLFLVDDEINSRLNEEPRSGFHNGLRDVGDFFEPMGLMGKTNVFYAAFATVGYFTRQDRIQRPFKQLIYAHWIAGVSRQLMARGIGRVRPRDGGTSTTFDFGEGKSLPSGHSSSVAQVAYVLSHHIDWTPATIALYGMAGSVLFQRVDSGAHWASDAWLGAAYGWAVARIVVEVEEGRLAEGTSLTVVPSAAGPALQVTLPVSWGR